jgi:hypothetical protein
MKSFFKKVDINQDNSFLYYFYYYMKEELNKLETIEDVEVFLKNNNFNYSPPVFLTNLLTHGKPFLISNLYYEDSFTIYWFSPMIGKYYKAYNFEIFF